MSEYSIRQLSELSGIKAHTIRIWEKRYQIFTPTRTSTNIRIYSDQQLKMLINVSVLLQHKYKISSLAKFNEEKIHTLVTDLEPKTQALDIQKTIGQLIKSMIDLKEEDFILELQRHIVNYSFEETIEQLIYPFLRRVGILWLSGKIHPAQEHFISNLIRQKIICEIAHLPSLKAEKQKTYILFLKENEWHEIALLMAYYHLKKNGHSVFYFGQNTPVLDVKRSISSTHADHILTICTHPLSDKKAQRFVDQLSELERPIFLSTNCKTLQKKCQTKIQNIHLLNDLEDFKLRCL